MSHNSLKNMPEMEFPQNLHAKIMRRIMFYKFRTALLLLSAFLAANLGLIIYRISVHVSEFQSFAILSSILKDFELSWEYLSSLLSMGAEVLPLNLLVFGVINAALLAYLISLSFKFKKLINGSAA